MVNAQIIVPIGPEFCPLVGYRQQNVIQRSASIQHAIVVVGEKVRHALFLATL
jgi:hypothetical protein